MYKIIFIGSSEIEAYPGALTINNNLCNDSLQHQESSVSVSFPYDEDLFKFLMTENTVKALVLDDDKTVFTGLLGSDFSFVDKGKLEAIDKIQLTLKDYTSKLDVNITEEIGFVDEELKNIVQKLCEIAKIETNTTTLPTQHQIKAFVLAQNSNIKQPFEQLLYQNGYQYYFDEEGKLCLIDFTTINPNFSLTENDLFLELSATKLNKAFAGVKINYTTIEKKENELVYFQSAGYNSDNTVADIILQPKSYFPPESTPEIEATEGKIYQSFSKGFATTKTKYNGEVEYQRSEDSQLLYTQNHKLEYDWSEEITVNRTEFGFTQAAVRLYNPTEHDTTIKALTIRADAYYTKTKNFVTTAENGKNYTAECQYIFTAEQASNFAQLLHKFFVGNKLKYTVKTTQKITPGTFGTISTDTTGVDATLYAIGCAYNPEDNLYTSTLISIDNYSVDPKPHKTTTTEDFYNATQKEIEDIKNGTSIAILPPDNIVEVKAIAEEGGIQFYFERIGTGLKNSLKKIHVDLRKNSESDFRKIELTEGYFYPFTSNDRFLEGSVLENWEIRARAENIFNKVSKNYTYTFVDVSKYGTWQLGKPNIFAQVLDRSAFLTLSMPSRSDNKAVYGNIRYKIVIQRIGNKDIEGTEDYVEPDRDWYKPATSASWQTSEDNYKQGSAVTSYDDWLPCSSAYSQTLPLVGQTNKNSVATEYCYKVIAYNEAGYSSESNIISVTALPTNIADLVHSNDNYKDLYVQRLSAISANVGLISQGGFGSFEKAENYWALSKLFPEDTGLEKVIEKGAFRVGGKDQYIWVEPVVENGRVIDYTVSVKAGNFIITSLGTQINGELIVQKSDVSDERTRITPSGTYFERKVGSDWQIINRFDTSGVLSPSYRADKQVLIGNFSQQQQRMLNHDIGRAYLSSNGRVWHFDENYYSNYGTLDGLEISGEYNLYGTNDSSGIDYTPAIKAVAPYCQIARCIAGNFSIKKTISTKTATVDFWLQYLYAENQQLFSVGTIDDSIALVIAGDEPVFCTSGVVTWSNSGETVYTTSRNPSAGDFVYATVNNAETSTSPIGEIVSKVVDENYLTTKIITSIKEYSFKSGDADFNWEIFADESAWVNSSVLANRAVSKDMFLNVNHQGEKQSYLLNELFNSDDQVFKHGQWYHLALIFGTDNLTFVIDKKYRNFVRTGTTTSSFDIVLNTNKNKVIIDELYIDTAVESVSDFIKNTDEKIPWASLDSGKNWFVFDAEDTSLVKSNILDNFEQKIIDKTVHGQEISMTGLGFANNEVVAPIDLWKVLFQKFGPSGQLYISWSNANAAYIGSDTNKIILNGGIFSYSCGNPQSTWKVFSGIYVDVGGNTYTISCRISGDTSSNTWNIKTL